uniref:hypothetical protein n=1 Tax=Alistipes megaguti TaxID=2364787 RepID=UPI000EFD4253|nr:hypothetical protein [Alistipes megaguti]
MKHTVITALLLAALPLANGCSDNSEVFYSISYPIVRIEAQVTLPESEPTPEEPSTGEGTETGGNDGTGSGTGTGTGSGSGSDTGTGEGEGTEEPVDPLVAQIQAEVLAEAPVQVGGRYVLDFTRYNRGPLTVDTASEAGTVQGAFFKEPGASEINLFFLEDNYACTISSYRDTDGKYKVLLTVDLTEIYQQRYPSAGLTKVVRQEYTSTPSN